MRRIGFLLILVGLWVTPVFNGSNPDDIEFKIRFVGDQSLFHIGEPIEIEISYSTQIEKKYLGSWTSPSPGLEGVTPTLTPSDGVLDLRAVRDYMGFAGSILSSTGFLGSQPVIQRLDLGDWYRFQKPGHYAVTVQSGEVSRAKGGEEGGGQERLSLESNPLEFNIVADPAWSMVEVEEIERVLKNEEDPERYRALHRLILLDTPASVRKLVHLYLSKADVTDNSGGVVYRGLRESSQIDEIIPLLEAALSDPQVEPREGMTDLLAGLQVRKELGVLPPRPQDPIGQTEWKDRYDARTKVFQEYLAKANALVLQSIKRRSGPERAAAIYQVWFTAERQNVSKPVDSEILSRVRSEVLSTALELGPGERVQILYSMWPRQPHGELKSIVVSVAESRRKEDSFYLDEGYKFWCEGWPQECSSAILSDAIHPGTPTSKNAVFMIAESEHPELDEILEARLKDPGMTQDSWESQRAAAIILRAGSRKLRPAVDEFLDKYVAQPRYGCEIEGYLIGYLFRTAVEDATNRFTEETGNGDHPCASQLLRTLDTVRYSDELVPLAAKALNSGDLGSAGMAATFLGFRGSATVEPTLWQRLETLREKWRERAAELRGADTRILDGGGREQAAQLERARTVQLEQALVSALVRSANWKLTPGEQERLREGCLTEECRDIADGKMSIGF
ncbi:MAG: hypothetical protein P4L51_20515 [Puia sp.]|nr:hypothetical protein [Puia sp.]